MTRGCWTASVNTNNLRARRRCSHPRSTHSSRWCDRRESILSASGSSQRPKAPTVAGGAPPCCLPRFRPAARCATSKKRQTGTRSLDTSRRRAWRPPNVEAFDEQQPDHARPRTLDTNAPAKDASGPPGPRCPPSSRPRLKQRAGGKGSAFGVRGNEALSSSVPACLECLFNS